MYENGQKMHNLCAHGMLTNQTTAEIYQFFVLKTYKNGQKMHSLEAPLKRLRKVNKNHAYVIPVKFFLNVTISKEIATQLAKGDSTHEVTKYLFYSDLQCC